MIPGGQTQWSYNTLRQWGNNSTTQNRVPVLVSGITTASSSLAVGTGPQLCITLERERAVLEKSRFRRARKSWYWSADQSYSPAEWALGSVLNLERGEYPELKINPFIVDDSLLSKACATESESGQFFRIETRAKIGHEAGMTKVSGHIVDKKRGWLLLHQKVANPNSFS